MVGGGLTPLQRCFSQVVLSRRKKTKQKQNKTKLEEYYSARSVAHWCTILLLSVYPRSVVGSTQAFTAANKSPVSLVQQLISLTKLLGPHKLTGKSIIYTQTSFIEFMK